MTSKLQQHDELLPALPPQPKPEKGAPRPGQERCSEQYMDDVLAHISPDHKRKDGWLQVIAAFVDADVICGDGQPLPYDDKIWKLQKWSAKGATYDEVDFEKAWEWYAERTDDEDRTRVGLGTIDTYARATGYSGPSPTKSAQIVEKSSPFKPVGINDDATPEAWGPPLRSMKDISGPAPARQWAAGTDKDGWVPLNDVTFLYGPDGVGKTLLAGQICLAAARGENLCGVIPFRKMPSLLIACEDDKDELHRRFEKQGKRSEDQTYFASFGGYETRLNRRANENQDTPFYRYIARKLDGLGEGLKLLVIDNLFQIYQGSYVDPAEVAPFINLYCRRLALEHDATVIVLAHPSMSQKQSGDGGYGGVSWSAGVRNRLYFDYLRDDEGKKISDLRVLSRKKANYATEHGQNEGIYVRWDDWKFRLSTDKDIQFQTQIVDVAEAEAVLRYIHEHDFREGFSIAPNVAAGKRKLVKKSISCNLGNGVYLLSATQIRNAVERLLEFGLLKETPNPKGNKALRCANPHKNGAAPGICDDAEMEALCEEFLGRGRKPPRDPEEHTPSEPVKVRKPRRRTKRTANDGPFEAQRKQQRRKR